MKLCELGETWRCRRAFWWCIAFFSVLAHNYWVRVYQRLGVFVLFFAFAYLNWTINNPCNVKSYKHNCQSENQNGTNPTFNIYMDWRLFRHNRKGTTCLFQCRLHTTATGLSCMRAHTHEYSSMHFNLKSNWISMIKRWQRWPLHYSVDFFFF